MPVIPWETDRGRTLRKWGQPDCRVGALSQKRKRNYIDSIWYSGKWTKKKVTLAYFVFVLHSLSVCIYVYMYVCCYLCSSIWVKVWEQLVVLIAFFTLLFVLGLKFRLSSLMPSTFTSCQFDFLLLLCWFGFFRCSHCLAQSSLELTLYHFLSPNSQ